MEDEIQLGDKVKCIYTGYTGIAVAKTKFINGCIQFSVAPKWDGKAQFIEEASIDEKSLEIVKAKPKSKEEKRSGGSSRKGIKFRGY